MGQLKDCCGCVQMPQPGLPLSHKAEHIFNETNLSEKLEYLEIMIILIGKGNAYSLLQK